MSKHDDNISLRQMLDHAAEAVALAAGKTREQFKNDRVLQLALVRLVEILGEAANRVSADGKEKYKVIPWVQVIGMRNRLIHGYDAINLDRVWDTIENDLPPIIAALRVIIKDTK